MARGLKQALLGALTRLACGALVVDREWKVILANPAAERLLGDGLCVNQGRLRPTSYKHHGAFARLMKSVLHEEADITAIETLALPRANAKRPLLVQAVPLSPSSQDIPADAAALVLAIDPEEDNDRSPVEMLRLLGLTPSEARLAALIGNGHSRAEAASALGISEATASGTIKQVYSKLNLSRQSELVRLVDRLAPLLPHSGSKQRI